MAGFAALQLVQNKKRTVTFTLSTGTVVGKQCRLKAKTNLEDADASALWTKTTADFSLAGVVATIHLTASNLNYAGKIYLIFECDIDNNNTVSRIVEVSLTPDAAA